jgi:hypothetical protein
MSLKDQMPFFNDPPPWYYRVMAAVFGLGIVVLLYPAVLCLMGHEYWPLLIFGGTMFFAVMTIRSLLRSARRKESEIDKL